MKGLIKTSRFLSFILRHDPGNIGLKLDAEGWAKVEELISCANNHGVTFTLDTLKEVVENNDKQRFRFSDDMTMIRANQGHSIDINLNLQAVMPPEVLYHGTATRFWESIQQEGLVKGSRQYVHLSPDAITAYKVGIRHGHPLILKVDAAQMYIDGHSFYCSYNGVWLTVYVPIHYIYKNE